VVVHSALVDGSFGLRNELSAPHVAVPFRSAVDGDLGTLLGVGVGRVLEVGREVDVFVGRARSVDVVLVVSDLVSPRPLVEIRTRGHVVEAAIPKDGACESISTVFA
jgi:hypothetical protein